MNRENEGSGEKVTSMHGQSTASTVGQTESMDQSLIGANAYNAHFPWAFRCTWDRSASRCPFPAHSFGRAMSQQDIERIAAHMMANPDTDALPLSQVAAMGPHESTWTVVLDGSPAAARDQP